MKISDTLINKYKIQVDFLFTLPWTLSFYDANGRALWRSRVSFKDAGPAYVMLPKSDIVLLDGEPTHWDIIRGRYKIEGEAGPGKEINTPPKVYKDGAMKVDQLVVHFKLSK